jgi:hypothetical protein
MDGTIPPWMSLKNCVTLSSMVNSSLY